MVVFKGDEKPAKEWDCVLIYDEEKQTFTLEKLDSLVNLNFDGKAQPRARPTASRTFPPSPSRLLNSHIRLHLTLALVQHPPPLHPHKRHSARRCAQPLMSSKPN